jgi:hypothetical protein
MEQEAKGEKNFPGPPRSAGGDPPSSQMDGPSEGQPSHNHSASHGAHCLSVPVGLCPFTSDWDLNRHHRQGLGRMWELGWGSVQPYTYEVRLPQNESGHLPAFPGTKWLV